VKTLIQRLQDLPPDLLAELVAESERFGHRFIRRLVSNWLDGTNRFAAPGEGLFAAYLGSQIIGVCGLSIDPYTTEPRVGRVRHLYVLETHRRRGIGRRLVMAIIDAAEGMFGCLRLRTENPEAAQFYESLGFRRCTGNADCTHVKNLEADCLTGSCD
jgi:GNAT superfamily N-acetyltransferase